MTDPLLLLAIVAALGTAIGAVVAAISTTRKIGTEKTDIKITTADKVMVGQDRFIESLEATMVKMQDQMTRLSGDVESLREELRNVTEERDRLRSENAELRRRVYHLEQRVEDLSNHESRGQRREREDNE